MLYGTYHTQDLRLFDFDWLGVPRISRIYSHTRRDQFIAPTSEIHKKELYEDYERLLEVGIGKH